MIATPLARYSAWQRRGDFIFLSGVIAVEPAEGKIIKGFNDFFQTKNKEIRTQNKKTKIIQ